MDATSTPRVLPRAVHGAIESAVVMEQIRRELVAPTNAATLDDTSDEQHSDRDSAASSSEKTTKKTKTAANADKKRKPTYYMRKDEMAQLQDEIAALEKKLKTLEGEPGQMQKSVANSIERHQGLRGRIRHGDLAVARAQSLISSYGPQRSSPPLGDFIHLTADPSDRHNTLSSLKASKMHEAVTYILARCQFFDISKTTNQSEMFETESGDFVTTHWEVTPLIEARSVLLAHYALMYFTDTQEMSMTEKLGVLTIRESDLDRIDGTQAMRMLSTHDNGIQDETNLVVYSQYFDKSELLDRPHSVQVVDYIDQDDLYPFQPRSRVRKDVSTVTMITQCPSRRPGGPPLVTIVRWAFIRVNNSRYTKPRDLEFVAREGVGKWCDTMLKCIRERLTWQNSR